MRLGYTKDFHPQHLTVSQRQSKASYSMATIRTYSKHTTEIGYTPKSCTGWGQHFSAVPERLVDRSPSRLIGAAQGHFAPLH